jgi:hypothetical protein
VVLIVITIFQLFDAGCGAVRYNGPGDNKVVEGPDWGAGVFASWGGSQDSGNSVWAKVSGGGFLGHITLIWCDQNLLVDSLLLVCLGCVGG